MRTYQSMNIDFETKHKLPFEAAPWEGNLIVDEGFMRFRIGTCEGLWRHTDKHYEILAVMNDKPGNGHFEDVLQWFEHSCKRDKRKLKISEVWNKAFKKHLIKKRGFRKIGLDDVEKTIR